MKRFEKILSHGIMVTGMVMILFLFFATSPVIAEKSSNEGFLGVSVEKISTDEMKELNISHGVRVIDVVEGEAAEKAGIQEGDIIQFVDMKKIETPGDLVKGIRNNAPATRVKIKLLRDKKIEEISVVLGKFEPMEGFHNRPDKRSFKLLFKDGAYLGIHMCRLNQELAEYFKVKPDNGVLILSVDKDSPANKAGLKAGDVIVKLNEKSIRSPEEARDIISEMKGGDKVDISVIRHGKKTVLEAELEKGRGFRGMNILKWHNKGRCEIVIPEISIPEISIPEIYLEVPDFKDCKIIIHKNLKKVEKKLKEAEKKIRRKLENIRECLCI
jgi:predicted metalloprotease with PDZ domain